MKYLKLFLSVFAVSSSCFILGIYVGNGSLVIFHYKILLFFIGWLAGWKLFEITILDK